MKNTGTDPAIALSDTACTIEELHSLLNAVMDEINRILTLHDVIIDGMEDTLLHNGYRIMFPARYESNLTLCCIQRDLIDHLIERIKPYESK